MNTCTDSKPYYLSTGTLNKDFYEDYLKSNAHSYANKLVSKIWSEDPDIFIDYMVVGLAGRKQYLYGELWLLDILDETDKYFPVLVQDINTSSVYSLSRCEMDSNDEEPFEFNIEQILELVTDKINI